jgi:hypothetical protein
MEAAQGRALTDASKYIKKGQPVTASVCLTSSGSASAEPGTSFRF